MQKIFQKEFNLKKFHMFGCKNITKTINNKLILDNVDVFVDVGEIRTIIGPSGGGKSSLLGCLSNIENPTSGEIFMDEINITFSHDKEHGKKKFSYPKVILLSQGLFLRPHMTVERNILLPLQENNIFDKKEYDKLIKQLHLGDLLQKYPLECSGGERQRISLVRSFLLKSKYLLLDEITSALDIEHVKVVSELLQEYKKKVGIILVTHMIHFAKKLSDYIYFMDGGKIVEEGTDIISNPQTKRLKEFLNTY